MSIPRGCNFSQKHPEGDDGTNRPASYSSPKRETAMKHSKKTKAAFTLTEVMIVVLITGILAALALPSVTRARHKAQIAACQNNLRLLNDSAQQYLFVNPNPGVMSAEQLRPFFFQEKIPLCPANGIYEVYTDPSIIPTCSIGQAEGHWINVGQ